MSFIQSSFIKPVSIALLAAAITACSTPAALNTPKAEVALNNEDWYQVRTENELYLFDDSAVFNQFLQTGKAPYTQSLDKKDNFGRSIILALRAEDQGKDINTLAAKRFLDINMPPAGKFYGEIREGEVIYVFSRYGEMIDMFKIGEPTFRYTVLGAGPKGERLVYSLAKEEKKPEATIKLFQQKYKLASAQ